MNSLAEATQHVVSINADRLAIAPAVATTELVPSTFQLLFQHLDFGRKGDRALRPT